MGGLDPLHGGQPAFCEPQSASCRPSARCTSQIAARRIDARHVRMVSTELLGLAANPRAASRKPQAASQASAPMIWPGQLGRKPYGAGRNPQNLIFNAF